MRNKSKLRWIFLTAFTVLFLFSAGMLIRLQIQAKHKQQAFEDLFSSIDAENIDAENEPPTVESEKYQSPYLPLKKKIPIFTAGFLSRERTSATR